MMRLALALFLATACSGTSKQDTQGPGSGSGSAVLVKKVLLSWGITQQATTAELFLQVTDETGKQVSHPVGAYDGQCAVTTPGPDMDAIIGVACKNGATGIELHAVIRESSVIVVKLRVDDGVTPDPMAREEVTRVPVPVGAAIEAG